MNITTCLAIDKLEDTGLYPQLQFANLKKRREIYWKLVFVFCCSGIRCRPNDTHLVYTNDLDDVIANGFNITRRLRELGVQIIPLEFEKYDPGAKLSKQFRNCFYRMDVLEALSKRSGASLLLDNDVIWTRPAPDLTAAMESGKLCVYDIYTRADTPELKFPHNLSMAEMGETFREIDPNYPVQYPIWYGGEAVGGSQQCLQHLTKALETHFFAVKNKMIADDKLIVMKNGTPMFNTDEFMFSYVYNLPEFDKQPLNSWVRRLWTQGNTNVQPDSANAALWHLPQEKQVGFRMLYEDAVNDKSKFWTTPVEVFYEYTGPLTGIPSRRKDWRYFNIKAQIKISNLRARLGF